MSFLSKLFGKRRKGKVNAQITKLPSSPAEKDSTEVRLPSAQQASHEIPEIKDTKPFEAKKIPVWKPGDVILDHYEIEDVITSGGMGRIYIANHRNWKVKVAIKSPTEEMLKGKDLFSRVEKEAEAWTELGLHPNIAYCYFVRKIEDVPHIFVEYVDGGNLRQWIEDGRCADLKTGLDLAIQFCHGMAYAHSKGMIHRDIKPENILMTQDVTLKITGFGIAKWGR
jgi:serine/threonine protein kinase